MLWFQSVDSIVADFQRKVNTLNELVLHHHAKVDYYHSVIIDAEEEKASHEAEAKRALAVAKKIEALINV